VQLMKGSNATDAIAVYAVILANPDSGTEIT
jgi:hypothetical protein